MRRPTILSMGYGVMEKESILGKDSPRQVFVNVQNSGDGTVNVGMYFSDNESWLVKNITGNAVVEVTKIPKKS